MKARILSIVTAVSLCLISWSLIAYAQGIVGSMGPSSVGIALPGQIPGTTTNDNASAGNVGELIFSGSLRQQTATVTITIASPAVISWTANPFFTRPGDGATPIPACASVVTFTNSGGALPTGITSGTPYYVLCGASLTANSFEIATSTANAIAGTAVNTSGSQSGTQTGTAAITMTSAQQIDFGALSLTAGDWQVSGTMVIVPQATTSFTNYRTLIGTTSDTISTATAYTIAGPAMAAEVPGAVPIFQPMAPARVSLASMTTVFCVGFATFSVTTNISTSGTCQARRER